MILVRTNEFYDEATKYGFVNEKMSRKNFIQKSLLNA